jgi:phage/plasmid-like protein (TIGR03299 family)
MVGKGRPKEGAMAHDLWIQDGEAAMFYVGDPPWHGLGQRLDAPATAAEAIQAAGLDWDVAKCPLYLFGQSRLNEVKGTYAVVPANRVGQDNCPVFGIVGEQYRPLQNRDAFSFFDPIVGEHAAIYHTAGALGQGERIWILAQLPGHVLVAHDDPVERYVLLSNSHDGEGSVQVKFTPIRVVCQNTLVQALSRGPTVRVAHLPDLEQRLAEARRLLGFIDHAYERLGTTFTAMAKVTLDSQGLRAYLHDVFPDPRDPDDLAARERIEASRFWVECLSMRGRGNDAPGVKGTLWAAYNGVAEFVDHGYFHRPLTEGPSPRRLHSVWFGEGYRAKARALEAAEARLQN